jgi:hypothetical protein
MTKLSAFTNIQLSARTNPGARRFLTSAMMVMTAVCLMNGVAFAQNNLEANDAVDRGGQAGFCSGTATLLFHSCGFEAQDDFFKEQAICLNVSDNTERTQCFADTITAQNENQQLCRAQLTARRNVCKSLGENRYDPTFNPALFDTNFRRLTNPNPYFPLTIGNTWEYAGEGETISIEILNETKLIDGVTCLVVRDRVTVDDELVEDTDDWFAQAKNGDVYYCGEEVKDFESFDGDKPRLPELVSIDGSFKVGRDGDKPGILFPRVSTVGKVRRLEFSVANAEDVVEVLSTTYRFGSNPTLDQFVPRQLAERLCSAGNCVVTKDFTPLSPGVFERKYYARGIGFFLEVKPDTGEAVQLVNCNFDARCNGLPTP